MKGSRLISLFRAFDPDEFKAFETFLASPYFNQSEKLVKLFRLIKPHYPEFESDKLLKEKIYSALHGKKKEASYSESTIRELISEMLKLARTFLAHNTLKRDNLEASVMRYNWFFEHHLENLAETELQNRKMLLETYGAHDLSYFHHTWLNGLHQFEITATQLQDKEHKWLKDFDLLAHVHALNRHYLINSFTVYTYLLAVERIYKFRVDKEQLEDIEKLALKYVNKGDTVIDIFYNIFQLARTDGEQYFYGLKTRFLANDKVVPMAVMLEAGVALENYCMKKLRHGIQYFTKEIMEVFRFEVEHGYMMQSGHISQVFYFNVAIMGSETGDIDWTLNFVETHKKLLPDEHRHDAYSFAKAHILFEQNNFREVLRLALSCQMTFFIAKIQIRNLLARAQYELGMFDELQVELRAQGHHIKDEKLTDDRKRFYETFIRILKQLAELKGNYNHQKALDVSQQIEAEKMFANKRWFVEKINALQDKHKHKRGTYS